MRGGPVSAGPCRPLGVPAGVGCDAVTLSRTAARAAVTPPPTEVLHGSPSAAGPPGSPGLWGEEALGPAVSTPGSPWCFCAAPESGAPRASMHRAGASHILPGEGAPEKGRPSRRLSASVGLWETWRGLRPRGSSPVPAAPAAWSPRSATRASPRRLSQLHGIPSPDWPRGGGGSAVLPEDPPQGLPYFWERGTGCRLQGCRPASGRWGDLGFSPGSDQGSRIVAGGRLEPWRPVRGPGLEARSQGEQTPRWCLGDRQPSCLGVEWAG